MYAPFSLFKKNANIDNKVSCDKNNKCYETSNHFYKTLFFDEFQTQNKVKRLEQKLSKQ